MFTIPNNYITLQKNCYAFTYIHSKLEAYIILAEEINAWFSPLFEGFSLMLKSQWWIYTF